MTNRGIQNPFSSSLVPVILLIVIPVIRSLIPIAKLEFSFDLHPYLFLIEEFPSKSRNCFLFLRKSVCPESALRILWIRHSGGCPSRVLSGGWWFLSLLDRILSHKPPWITLDILLRQSIRLCLDLLGVTLKLWVLDNPNLLEPRVVDKWGCDLPFLFEVLPVTKTLSIQAHPNKALAETLLTQIMSANSDETKDVILRMENRLISEKNYRELSEKERLVLELEKQYTGVALQPLHCCYAHKKETQVQFDCVSLNCVVELRLHQSGFFEIALSRIHVGLAMFGWESLDISESESWDGLFEEIYKDEVFQNDLGTEVLVPLYLHFRISFGHIGFHVTFCEKRFSHKWLHTNRNKEKSNMKLDNNGSSGRLASKATLRKASSNSLLLYFLLVYGAYICVCNNCVSIILYVFVTTLLD